MFFSLRMAFLLLVSLALLFALGTAINTLPAEGLLFKQMNVTRFFALYNEYFSHPLVFLWLTGLILVGFLLFANTLCCTWKQLNGHRKQSRQMQNNRARSRGMVIIHVIAILVIAFHAIDIALISRHKPQLLFPQNTATMGDYNVTVTGLAYVSDRAPITQKQQNQRVNVLKIPAGEFSLSDNKVTLSISHNGKEQKTGSLSMLRPLYHRGTFFILDGFIIPYGSEDGAVAARIHSTYNPLVTPFFLVYLALLTFLILQGVQNRYRPSTRDTTTTPGN